MPPHLGLQRPVESLQLTVGLGMVRFLSLSDVCRDPEARSQDCRCPCSLRRAASHTHKAGSVVRQDGCRSTKRQNCLLSTFTAFRACCLFDTPYPVMHREASSRYVIRFRSLTRKSFMTCQSVCHMALEYCRSNLTHLRFLPLRGTTPPARVLSLFCIRYGAYVFVRQCLGDPSHPRTASPALGQYHLDFLIRYCLGGRSTSTD